MTQAAPHGELAVYTAQAPAVRAAGQWLRNQHSAIARRLAPGQDAERYEALVLSTILADSTLLECFETEKGQQSVALAIYEMASLGIEPGPLGHGYLVGFRNNTDRFTKCTFILGWKGMVALALRSPKVADVDVQAVYADDEFEWERGTNPRIYHRPVYDGPPDLGRLTHVYAVCHTVNGGRPFEVLTKAQALHYRSISKQPNGFGWKNHPVPMCKKTVVRRGFPLWPVRTQDLVAVHQDEEREDGVGDEDPRGETVDDRTPPRARTVRATRAATRAPEALEPAPSRETPPPPAQGRQSRRTEPERPPPPDDPPTRPPREQRQAPPPPDSGEVPEQGKAMTPTQYLGLICRGGGIDRDRMLRVLFGHTRQSDLTPADVQEAIRTVQAFRRGELRFQVVEGDDVIQTVGGGGS